MYDKKQNPYEDKIPLLQMGDFPKKYAHGQLVWVGE